MVSTKGKNDLLALVLLNSSFDTIGIAEVSTWYRSVDIQGNICTLLTQKT